MKISQKVFGFPDKFFSNQLREILPIMTKTLVIGNRCVKKLSHLKCNACSSLASKYVTCTLLLAF